MTSSSPLSPSQTTQPQGFGAVEQPIAESRSVYVPLNVHSQYSILNSTASVSLLAKTAKRFKMPAIAITDDGNLYGVVDFYKACRSQGVKPIIGCEMWMAPSSRFEKKRTPGLSNGMPIVLLAKDYVGFQHLSRLSSIGFLEGFYYQPRIDKEVLAAHKEGLICLYGHCSDIEWYQNLFGENLYLEIQRHPFRDDGIQESWLVQKMREYSANQQKLNEKLIELSKQCKIELVATNN